MRTNSSLAPDPYNKRSKKIDTRPPSPTNTNSTITQSASNSNSVSTPSTSPPQPITPPRFGRSRTRYPELGRVPLHRRGMSQTYERLEDLLREAGYKETRIFTPELSNYESDQGSIDAKADKRISVRGGVGAFVGYLAGLMPSALASRASLTEDGIRTAAETTSRSSHEHSPFTSPLEQCRPSNERQGTSSSMESHSPSVMASSIEKVEPTPRPLRLNLSVQSNARSQPSSPFSPSTSNKGLHLQQRLVHRVSNQSVSYTSPHGSSFKANSTPSPGSHLASLSPLPVAPPIPKTQQLLTQQQPSRAGAYLRHIASAPDMPKRPSSSPVHRNRARRRKTFDIDESDTDNTTIATSSPYENTPDEDNRTSQPPLPSTWLETVARAVLFGGVGAYIGGPSNNNTAMESSRSPPRIAHLSIPRRPLRQTRSSLSQVTPKRHLRPLSSARSRLSDRTNSGLGVSGVGGGGEVVVLTPPELFLKVGRGRAGMSTGEVSRTRVVCRSAPASRASSRIRGEDGKEKKQIHEGNGGKERGRVKKKAGTKREEAESVPILANTNVEEDGWDRGKRVVERQEDCQQPQQHYQSSAKTRYLSGWGIDPFLSDEDGRQVSSDEEGELNLARMLVNPRRQNSIKSLRKHLARMNDDLGGGGQLKKGSAKAVSVGVSAAVRAGVKQGVRDDDDWDGSEVEDWGKGWVRRGKKGGLEGDGDGDDGYGYAVGFSAGGSGRSMAGKRSRRGVPGPWALFGGGS